MATACPVRGLEPGDFDKLAKYAAGVMKTAYAAKLPFDQDFMKRSMMSLYNAIDKHTNGNKVSAANFVAAFPMAFKVMLEYKNDKGEKPYFNHAVATQFDFQTLNENIGMLDQVDAPERIKWVNEYLGLTEDLSLDYKTAVSTALEIQQRNQKELSAEETSFTAVPSSNIIIDSFKTTKSEKSNFVATPPTAIRTTGLENLIGTDTPDTSDPLKVFGYKVMRNIIDNITKMDENDSRNLILPGATNGVFTKFISRERVQQDGLEEFMPKGYENSPYYVTLINGNNEYLSFDEEGNNVMLRGDGKPVLYPVPNIELNKDNGLYYYANNKDMFGNSVASYMRYNNLDDIKQAQNIVQREMGVSHVIKNRLIENPMSNDIIGYVNGGSPGFILYDEGINNPVSGISFPNGKRFKVATVEQAKLKKGATYMYLPELNNFPIEVERPVLSDGLIDKISILLTEPDLYNEDTEKVMSIKNRKDIIQNLVNLFLYDRNGLLKLNDSLDPENMLTLRGTRYNLSTPEKRQAAKQEIKDILKTQHTYTTKDSRGNEKQNFIWPAKLNILQSLIDEDGIDTMNLKEKDGKYTYSENIENYENFILEQGIYVKYKKNEQNRLVRLNPYMTFGFDPEFYKQVLPETGNSKDIAESLDTLYELKEQYKGKFIYSTPGTGKTTVVKMSEDLVDADDLLLKYLVEQPGQTLFGDTYKEATNSTVGLYMTSLFEINPTAADEIYAKVLTEIKDLVSKGKTVLTGSHRYIPEVDMVFRDPDSSKLLEQLSRKSSPKHGNILNNSVMRITQSEVKAEMETPGKVAILDKQLWDVTTDSILFDKKKGPTPVFEKVDYAGKPEFNKLPAKSSVKNMTYAGIGSRETPSQYLDVMTKAAEYLESLGYTLRSGAADGADKAFEKGVKSRKDIFPGNKPAGEREHRIAEEMHPAWDKMLESTRKKAIEKGKDPKRSADYVANLMARNTNQIFGANLDSPVDFVLFYAQEVPGSIRPKGGTGQAVEMARRKGIPTINLADANWRDQLKKVLDSKPTSFIPVLDLSKEWKGDLDSRPVYSPEGVNMMRTRSADPSEHFGNPWSEGGYAGTIKVDGVQEAADNYREWLLGNKFQDVKPQQRKWILDQITRGKLDGANLLYSAKLEGRKEGNHPTELISVFEKLRFAYKQTDRKIPAGFDPVSPDYGVYKSDKELSTEKTEKYVALVRTQAELQIFKENVGKNANMMWHYGLRWGRRRGNPKMDIPPMFAPITNQPFDKGDFYGYDTKDQKGRPLPSLSVLKPIMDEITARTGIDMSNYDSVIANLYLEGEYIYPHRDTTEDISAEKYPVVVYTLGNDAALGIWDNNKGDMTFANTYDARYAPDELKGLAPTNEVLTKNGSIYTFGLEGKGRFNLVHTTPDVTSKPKAYPPIKLPDGTVVTNYTITLTFRRAQATDIASPTNYEDTTYEDLTPNKVITKKSITRDDLIKRERLINQDDVDQYNAYVSKFGKQPIEWFTHNTVFKEFYSPELGRRQRIPDAAFWNLDSNGLYDLYDRETGEIYLENVDMRSGFIYEDKNKPPVEEPEVVIDVKKEAKNPLKRWPLRFNMGYKRVAEWDQDEGRWQFVNKQGKLIPFGKLNDRLAKELAQKEGIVTFWYRELNDQQKQNVDKFIDDYYTYARMPETAIDTDEELHDMLYESDLRYRLMVDLAGRKFKDDPGFLKHLSKDTRKSAWATKGNWFQGQRVYGKGKSLQSFDINTITEIDFSTENFQGYDEIDAFNLAIEIVNDYPTNITRADLKDYRNKKNLAFNEQQLQKEFIDRYGLDLIEVSMRIPSSPIYDSKVKASKTKLSNKPGKGPADMGDIPFKNLFQKETEIKATEEQIKAAEEFYKTTPLAKFLPFQIIQNAMNLPHDKVAAWTKGGIILTKRADMTDYYHEAFEGFVRTFMTQDQLTELLRQTRNLPGTFVDYNGLTVSFSIASSDQLLEFLSEGFRNYMLDPSKYEFNTKQEKTIFEWLKQILRVLFDGATLDSLNNDPIEASAYIKNLYDKLRVGDLTGYSFQGIMDKKDRITTGMLSYAPMATKDKLTFAESATVTTTMDSLISEYVDLYPLVDKGLITEQERNAYVNAMDKTYMNRRNLITDEDKELINKVTGLLNNRVNQDGSFSIQLIRNKQRRSEIYSYVYRRLVNKLSLLKSDPGLTTPSLELAYKNKVALLDWVVSNYGDFSFSDNIQTDEFGNVKGVVAYHILNSEVIEVEDKEALVGNYDYNEDEIYDLGVDSGRDIFGDGGNKVSILERTDANLLHILKSLYEPGSKPGSVELNDLFTPKLISFDRVWNNMVRLLEGTRDREVMWNLIKQESENFPAYKQLLAKIGSPILDPSNYTIGGFVLWNKILNTFSNTHLPLIQTTIKKTTEVNGVALPVPRYEVTVGVASAIYRRIGDNWNRDIKEFNPNLGSERFYVLRDPETDQNYLDIDKLLKLGEPRSVNEMIYFLNKMGVQLQNSPAIRKIVANSEDLKDSIRSFRNKLRAIKEFNNNTTKDKIVIKDLGSFINMEVAGTKIASLSTGYTKILKLEARYSDYHSNFMVTNAEHNSQYEHTLNSTITTMLNILDDYVNFPTYQSIVALKKMRHLDIENTPFAKESVLLNSLFVLDVPKHHAEFGKRRKRKTTGEPIRLEMHLLSGITLLEDDEFVKGVGNASADAQSKLLEELHNFSRAQVLENVRHSDKTQSHSFSVDHIYANGKVTENYVPTRDFVEGTRKGFKKAAALMSKHLSAELERINQFRGLTKGQKARMFYDFEYVKRGKNFAIFEDMPDSLEEELLGLPVDMSLSERMEQDSALKERVMKYLIDYLDIQNKKVSDRIAEAEFIDPNLISEKEGADKPTREGLIASFVANSLIHNLESFVLIYGDPAMYKLEKEEFHKRNSGAGGTGTIMATDRSAMTFINDTRFNKDGYAKSVFGSSFSGRVYDGSLDTAVFEEPIVRSAYFDSIVEAKTADMKAEKPGITDEEIRENLFGSKTNKDGVKRIGTADNILGGQMKPYDNMKVADAQGYMTFDTYRMLRILGGRWTPTQEGYYRKIIAGQPLNVSTEKLLEIFPPEKYQYWGQIYNKTWEKQNMGNYGVMPLTGMHKFAIIPLIPNVIANNSTLVQLHEKMMKEGIGYATFESGSKISSIARYDSKTDGNNHDKIYNTEDGKVVDFSINEQMTNEAPKFKIVKNTIFIDYLKNQVEIDSRFKENISFSTQLRKIIEDGLMENGVPNDFMRGYTDNDRVQRWSDIKTEEEKEKTSPFYKRVRDYERHIEELTEIKKQELIEEMGITVDADGNIKSGIENFINFVKRELNRREIGNHTINSLGVNERGEPKIPLDLSLQADEIDNMLNNIITKRIVKLKVKGEAFIQVTNALFEDRAFAFGDNGRNFKKPTAEDLRKYGTIDLPYYYKVSENEKTVVKLGKAKVAMTGDFKNLFYLKDLEGNQIGVWESVIENGDRTQKLNMRASLDRLNTLLKNDAWLDTNDHRKMVTIAGPRIPVQGLNSAEAFEVYEFLDESAGPILIGPAELVAKSGSDFDKDTLFMMTPHIYRVNGKVKLSNKRLKGKMSKQEIDKRLYQLRGELNLTYEKFSEMEARASRMGVLKLTDEEQDALNNLTMEYRNQSRDLNQRIVGLESLFLEVNKGNIRGIEAVRISDNLYNAYVENDILRGNYESNKRLVLSRKNEAVEKFYKKKDAALKSINSEIESLTDQKMALKSGAVENDIITDYVGMISLPENFNKLTTPNDTNIAKPLADALGKIVKKYKPTEYLFSQKKAASGRVAGTRLMEIEYNLSKHEENNVGKQVLGIGAVDNTYNILYNRIGMHMKFYNSPYSDKEMDLLIEKQEKGQALTRDEVNALKNLWIQTIRMPHNKLKKNGFDVISLSHTYDVDGQHNIGNIISQLINGWVDVAKDSWVFNLQGNKEISPTLLFLIQSGVPFNQAVYFVSQPLVREYVRQQRGIKSAFGDAIDTITTPDQANMFRNQARANILSRNGFIESAKQRGDNGSYNFSNLRNQRYEIYRFANNYLEDYPDFDFQNLDDNLLKGLDSVDDFQRAAFLHFLQIEDMAKASTEFKTGTNVDTTKTGTVFSAIDRIIKIEKIKNNKFFPGEEMLDKIRTSSPISSFFVQEFQLKLVEKLFPIRDSKAVIEFIKDKANKVSDDVRDTFGENEDEDFWNSFRNNLVSFIFQNSLYTFPVESLTSYKGMAVDKTFDVKKVPGMIQRVVVSKDKDTGRDILYVDVKGIENDFNVGRYATTAKMELTVPVKGAQPYAKLDPNTFNVLDIGGQDPDLIDIFEEDPAQNKKPVITEKKEDYDETVYRQNSAKRNQYVKFVIEREILRSQIPLSTAKQQYDYQQILNNPKLIERTLAKETRELKAYEIFLKDRALDNIYNPFKMFVQPGATMADTFYKIKLQFKEQLEKYAVIEALTTDSMRNDDGTVRAGIKNIRLRNPKPTKQQINIFNENIRELADRGVIKVADKATNDFISDFFSRMTIFGYVQSGLNYRGRFNLNKILPQDKFIDFMTSKIKPYAEYLAQENGGLALFELYYSKFINAENVVNKRYGGSARYKAYYEPFTLEYLRKLDRRKKGSKELLLPARELAINRAYVDEFGMAYFKPEVVYTSETKNRTDVKKYYSSILNRYSKAKDKKLIFVHNALSDSSYADNLIPALNKDQENLPADVTMAAVPESNKYGITTLMNDVTNVKEIKDDIDPDTKKPVVNANMKQLIDNAMKDLNDMLETGQTILVFNEKGYGVHFRYTAPYTYGYLTEQLAKIGFANPGSRFHAPSMLNMEQYYKPAMTYEEAAEIYRKCLT